MALMIKANCEKQVPEDKVEEFIELGYSLLNEKGQIIKRGNPKNRDDLRIANASLKSELEQALSINDSLVKENETLKSENEALKSEIEGLTASLNDKDGKKKAK